MHDTVSVLDPHNPGYLLDILPPDNVPEMSTSGEPRWRRHYETLCRLGARQQPKVVMLVPVTSLPALGPGHPSRTGPLARKYLQGFPYS